MWTADDNLCSSGNLVLGVLPAGVPAPRVSASRNFVQFLL